VQETNLYMMTVIQGFLNSQAPKDKTPRKRKKKAATDPFQSQKALESNLLLQQVYENFFSSQDASYRSTCFKTLFNISQD